MIKIKLEGAEELIGKLTTLAQFNKVRARISQEGIYLRGKMISYPARVHSGNPLIKSNDRVRKAFFAKLRSGEISVPYKRTGNLKNHWSVESGLNGFTATIGNNALYAELVQGPEQAKTHQWSGWLTTTGAMNIYGPEIIANITQALEEEVKNVG